MHMMRIHIPFDRELNHEMFLVRVAQNLAVTLYKIKAYTNTENIKFVRSAVLFTNASLKQLDLPIIIIMAKRYIVGSIDGVKGFCKDFVLGELTAIYFTNDKL